MLTPGRYLLGVAELTLLAAFASWGAARLRSRLLPSCGGAPALLATTVLALALLLWTAELLGTVSLLKPLPYVAAVAAVGLALRLMPAANQASPPAGGAVAGVPRGAQAHSAEHHGGGPPRQYPPEGRLRPSAVSIVAVAIAAIAFAHFAAEARLKLSTGMTGFDSTWYHAPFAAGFAQTGSTFGLHFIAPQFLAWFYPANGEVFHAAGILAFSRDLLSPLLNLGWFLGCLLAAWCIGRPYEVAPWSLALGAVALSVPALADQAGEARNDLVGIFFLLAAVAVALNAAASGEERERYLGPGALLVAGLAAGLAAGTKLNFLLPAAVLVAGLAAVAPGGRRLRALLVAGLAALAGGGYWYLRNLIHSGNPLPWADHLGAISLPAPQQGLGGREAHSVLGYLGDGAVWSDWLLPGLHDGLSVAWPLLAGAALAGLLLAFLSGSRVAANRSSGSLVAYRATKEPRNGGGLPGGPPAVKAGGEPRAGRGGTDPVLALAGLAGLATAVAWLIAPTSASGPEGMPRGFESGLRYLAPALVLGLALLPAAPLLRDRMRRLAAARSPSRPHNDRNDDRPRLAGGRWAWALCVGGALAGLVAVGYPAQRHYLQSRYESPAFTTPGLNAAFSWARGVSDARIATTSTRQYPFFGTDLSNRVQFVGLERAHGGFEAPASCRSYRRTLNRGDYDYVVASRDRLEPGKPPFPPQARWTSDQGAKIVLKRPPTVVFQVTGPLNPSACP